MALGDAGYGRLLVFFQVISSLFLEQLWQNELPD